MPITYFVGFLVSLMVGASLTLVVRHLAHRFHWLDRAQSSRKIHAVPIPRLGGIAIVGGFFTPLAALLIVDSFVGNTFRGEPALVQGLFIGGSAIAALGLYDDFRGAGAPLKFGVQILVAAYLYSLGFRIEVLGNPFGPPLHLGFASPFFTCFWIVGVINAMNLIDGLDGLAGGVAFFGVGTNFILAASHGEHGDILMCLFMAVLAGAILGFLIFNFNPASIFMGDTGSMFLGFVLAAVSIKTSSKSGTAVSMLVPIIALGLPIMDTLLAMVRRSIMGRPVFSADKEHIHHRLMSRMLLSHRNAVLVLYALCCLFALTALGLSFANGPQSAMLLAGVAVVVMVLMRKLGYLSIRETAHAVVLRRRNVGLRSLVGDVIGQVRTAESVEKIWDAVVPLSSELGTSRLTLQVHRKIDGHAEAVTYETMREEGAALPFEIRLNLSGSGTPPGSLALTWRDGRSEVNRDEELALELIVDAISDAVRGLIDQRQERLARVLRLRKPGSNP